MSAQTKAMDFEENVLNFVTSIDCKSIHSLFQKQGWAKLKVKSTPYLKSGCMTGIITINKKERKLHKQRVGLEIAN